MRTATHIAIGVVVALALLAVMISVTFYFDAGRPEHRVGFQRVVVRDPQGTPLDVAIWYPTNSPPRLGLVDFTPQMLATDGAVTGRRLPLVLISNGAGEPLAGVADTALALASAGFVAAAIRQTDDETIDSRYVAMPRWLAARPREVHVVLGYMLNDWGAHRQLDGTRVGMFGYSNGGLTALISLGGVPNPAQIAARWPQPRVQRSSVPATLWAHDPIIKTAVLAAPAGGRLFEPDGLSRVTVSIQIWNGTIDRNVPIEKSAALVRRLLPKPPEFHAVPGAGHFTFLTPCPSVIRWAWFCIEADGFDRIAFHREFNRSMVAFFKRNI